MPNERKKKQKFYNDDMAPWEGKKNKHEENVIAWIIVGKSKWEIIVEKAKWDVIVGKSQRVIFVTTIARNKWEP